MSLSGIEKAWVRRVLVCFAAPGEILLQVILGAYRGVQEAAENIAIGWRGE